MQVDYLYCLHHYPSFQHCYFQNALYSKLLLPFYDVIDGILWTTINLSFKLCRKVSNNNHQLKGRHIIDCSSAFLLHNILRTTTIMIINLLFFRYADSSNNSIGINVLVVSSNSAYIFMQDGRL